MDSQSSQQLEILVHVTAPARITHDAAYRQLARSYLAFEPHSRNKLSTSFCQNGKPKDISTGQSALASVSLPEPPPAAFNDVYRESQELSFNDIIESTQSFNDNTTAAHQPRSTQQPVQGNEQRDYRSPRSPLSEIPDSYPMPDTGIFRITPTRILQRYMERNAPSTVSPSPKKGEVLSISDASQLPLSSSDDVKEHTQLNIDPPLPNYFNNVVPVTPLARCENKRKYSTIQDQEEVSVVVETYISSSSIISEQFEVNASQSPIAVQQVQAQTVSRADSEPPPPKRSIHHYPTADSHGIGPRSSSDPVHLHSTLSCDEMCHAASSSFSLEIRPPSPPVSMCNFQLEDLISPKLDKLAIDLSTRYKPLSHDPLPPLERGYWLIDCSSWTPEKIEDTWLFLANYLQSGLGGWGVWCRRSQVRTNDKTTWIRVYGWSYIAKHLYLLVYLASGRYIKFTGAKWHGPDGAVAITVPPSSRRYSNDNT